MDCLARIETPVARGNHTLGVFSLGHQDMREHSNDRRHGSYWRNATGQRVKLGAPADLVTGDLRAAGARSSKPEN
jgi:hypothetical protein